MTDRFAGTTPDPVARGSTLSVHFSNPDLAGQSVTVTIIDDNGVGETLEIQLDKKGSGSTEWTVPASWGDFATLQHETSDDHSVAVTGAGPAATKKKTTKKTPAKKPAARPAAKGKKR